MNKYLLVQANWVRKFIKIEKTSSTMRAFDCFSADSITAKLKVDGSICFLQGVKIVNESFFSKEVKFCEKNSTLRVSCSMPEEISNGN